MARPRTGRSRRGRIEGGSIVSVFREPVVAHTYTRATYANITATHFTWRGERSDDGKA